MALKFENLLIDNLMKIGNCKLKITLIFIHF